MMCEECHENPATVTISVVSGDQKTTRHLCADCMKKKQLELITGDIQGFVSSVLKSIVQEKTSKESTQTVRCSRCGLTFAEFQKTGRLGCAQCYQDFREQLSPVLLRIHGRTQHAGRAPFMNEHEREQRQAASTLRQQMDQAVQEENFEEAARLRDQLKALTDAMKEEQL